MVATKASDGGEASGVAADQDGEVIDPVINKLGHFGRFQARVSVLPLAIVFCPVYVCYYLLLLPLQLSPANAPATFFCYCPCYYLLLLPLLLSPATAHVTISCYCPCYYILLLPLQLSPATAPATISCYCLCNYLLLVPLLLSHATAPATISC